MSFFLLAKNLNQLLRFWNKKLTWLLGAATFDMVSLEPVEPEGEWAPSLLDTKSPTTSSSSDALYTHLK